jgi:5'-3' exonuclease
MAKRKKLKRLKSKEHSDKNLLVIMDANNTAYRSAMVMQLSNYFNASTSGIFGMLNSIRSTLSKFNPDDFALCWDGGLSTYRKTLYPEYKKGKKRKSEKIDREQLYEQMIDLRSLIRLLGIKQYRRKSVEADDVICQIADQYEGGDIIIVSTDKDFLQLITRTISVYNPVTGKLWTKKNFAEFDGLSFTPDEYLQYHIILGDESDNITGVHRVGKVTAKNLITEYGTYADALYALEDAAAGDGEKLSVHMQQFLTGSAIFERNRKLIDLREYVKMHFLPVHKKLIKPTVNFKSFLKVIKKPEYGFASIVDHFDFWSLPFKKLVIGDILELQQAVKSARSGQKHKKGHK